MKALYGIMGKGEGHITRARALIPELKRLGVEVDVVLAGRALTTGSSNPYFDLEEDIFGSNYTILHGLSFCTTNGSIDWHQTFFQNKSGSHFIREIDSIDVSCYDVVVSDLEPVTAIAGILAGKTVIGISRQYSHYSSSVPHSHPFFQMCLRWAFPATISLGVFWHPARDNSSTFIIPPIIAAPMEMETETEVVWRRRSPAIEEGRIFFVLVYLPFESSDEIIDILMTFSSPYLFVVYHPDFNNDSMYSPEDEDAHYDDSSNIVKKKISRFSFPKDLSLSHGVICNAGFGLMSEALQQGKKLLVKPLVGQPEQAANAATLRSLFGGDVMEILDEKKIEVWLNSLNGAPTSRLRIPNVAACVAEWLVAGDYEDTAKLQKLWKNTVLSCDDGGLDEDRQEQGLLDLLASDDELSTEEDQPSCWDILLVRRNIVAGFIVQVILRIFPPNRIRLYLTVYFIFPLLKVVMWLTKHGFAFSSGKTW